MSSRRPRPIVLPTARFRISLAVTIAGAMTSAASAGIAINRSVIILSETQAALTEPGTTYFIFNSPVIDNAGKVAFSMVFAGEAIDDINGTGIYYGLPGDWTLQRSGSAAPGYPGLTLQAANRPIMNRNGQMATVGFLQGPGTSQENQGVLYGGRLDNLVPLVRAGDAAPGVTDGATFFDIFTNAAKISPSGGIAFYAGLAGPDVTFENNQGIWYVSPEGVVQKIFRQGEASTTVPGTTNFFAESPQLSPTGRIVYSGILARPAPIAGEPATNEFAIWSKDDTMPNAPQRVVSRTGDAAPGYPVGTTIDLAIQPKISASSATYYTALVKGPSVAFEDAFAIYADRPGVPNDELLFRSGQVAPLLNEPTTLLAGFGDTAVNAADSMIVPAELSGAGIDDANNSALYRRDADASWNLIAREGAAAPGTGKFFTSLTFGAPGMNANGDVALYVGLKSNAADVDGELASLWLWNEATGLTLVALQGESVEVAPGDVRVIAEITLDSFALGSGLEDGRRSSFNDAGQLVYSVFFTDESAAILLSTPVPEPTHLLALAGAASLLKRRQR